MAVAFDMIKTKGAKIAITHDTTVVNLGRGPRPFVSSSENRVEADARNQATNEFRARMTSFTIREQRKPWK